MILKAVFGRASAAILCTLAVWPLWAAEPAKLVATSYGAAGEVSGSLHVLDTGNGRWMVDCGAEIEKNAPDAQGGQSHFRGAQNPRTLPAGVESVDALFLTHAHSDHLGRLPLLVERGFHGPIYMTEATAALAVPMLSVMLRTDRTTTRHWTWSKEYRLRAESGRKSLWLHWRKCKRCRGIAPEDTEQATGSMQELLDRFESRTTRMRVTVCDECVAEEVAALLHEARPVKYGAAIEAAPGVRVTLLDAGHIPGSASILFEVSFGAKKRRVLFSGDLGNGLSPLAAGPQPAPAVDAVYVECYLRDDPPQGLGPQRAGLVPPRRERVG